MNAIIKITIISVLSSTLLTSCIRNEEKRGRAYMPDMSESVAYDAGSTNPLYKDGKTNQLAPKGSIAQGKFIYSLPNTPEGYAQAATANVNSFTFTKEQIEGEGKKLYTVYCAICHGEKGDGQGHLVQINKFPPPPSYFSADLLAKPEGQRYHTLMFGKGMMGSYATQLNHKERWLVLSYVKAMQDANKPKATETTENSNSK